jgi:hypothetical protein
MRNNLQNKKSSLIRITLAILAFVVLSATFYFFVLPLFIAVKTTQEIDESFEILDFELERSRIIIGDGIENSNPYKQFESKKTELKDSEADLKNLEFWERKAVKIQKESAKVRGYILGECNEMIKIAENKDWVEQRDENGNIMNLKSAREIKNMDNYEIPTSYFLGISFDVDKPKENVRAYQLFKKIEKFRNAMLEELGTYKTSKNQFIFRAPKESLGLREAYTTCNPQDTSVIGEVYRRLTFPEMVKDNYSDNQVSYPYMMFNKAPIVAAYSVLTSLTVDVRQAEMIMAEHFLKKVIP